VEDGEVRRERLSEIGQREGIGKRPDPENVEVK
jgi:hypothetical protein